MDSPRSDELCTRLWCIHLLILVGRLEACDEHEAVDGTMEWVGARSLVLVDREICWCVPVIWELLSWWIDNRSNHRNRWSSRSGMQRSMMSFWTIRWPTLFIGAEVMSVLSSFEQKPQSNKPRSKHNSILSSSMLWRLCLLMLRNLFGALMTYWACTRRHNTCSKLNHINHWLSA
jgi:hypothetical protein